jgi:hypothetical protein
VRLRWCTVGAPSHHPTIGGSRRPRAASGCRWSCRGSAPATPPDVFVAWMRQPAWPHSTAPLLRHQWRAAASWELRLSLAGSLLHAVRRHPLRPQRRFRRRHVREDAAARAAHGARRTSLGLHPAWSSSLADVARMRDASLNTKYWNTGLAQT